MSVNYSEKVTSQTDEYRKRFIRLVIRQEDETQRGIDELNSEIDGLVRRYSTKSEVRDEEKINRGLPSLFDVWAAGLLLMMLKNNQEAAEIAGERQVDLIVSGFQYDPFTALIKQSGGDYSAWIAKRLENRKHPTDGIPVGTRIKTIQGGALKTVQNILAVGIREGKSVNEIASAIDNYMSKDGRKTWVSPYQWYRDKWGYKIKKQPRGIPAGSLSSNAIRIARSEINATWRQATVEIHKGHPWLKGYDWLLSSSHPQPDICDEWAAEGPYSAQNLPPGHPYCMCDVVPVFYTKEELDLG